MTGSRIESDSNSRKRKTPEAKTSGFTSEDFNQLSINPHERFLPNSQKVGHALIVENSDGSDKALQFNIASSGDAPRVRPLLNIQTSFPKLEVTKPLFTADTPDGTKMYAKRFLDLEFTENNKTKPLKLVYFSPTQPSESLFSAAEEKPVTWFRADLPKNIADNLNKTIPNKKINECVLDPKSIKARLESKARLKKPKCSHEPRTWPIFSKR